jgi:hypothetical protein
LETGDVAAELEACSLRLALKADGALPRRMRWNPLFSKAFSAARLRLAAIDLRSRSHAHDANMRSQAMRHPVA